MDSAHPKNRKEKLHFTEEKYINLPERRRHKKCATLLKMIYGGKIAGRDCREEIAHFNQLQRWSGGESLAAETFEAIADRYHLEMTLAGQSLKEHNLLPRICSGDREEGETPWPIAIFLSNLRSAHNVGSIIRTVEAMRLGTLYLGGTTPLPESAQVQKTSMGAYCHVPYYCVKGVEELPRPIIALETCDDAESLYDTLFPESFTLALGNEELGISQELLRSVDRIVSIPMRGRKNSLNVANAFSMAAFEIARQRQGDNHAPVR